MTRPSLRAHDSEDPQRKRQHSSSPVLQAEVQVPILKYTIFTYKTPDGKKTLRGKPNKFDYPIREWILIKKALKEYLLSIYTVHAFPNNEMAHTQASDTWRKVCHDASMRYSAEDTEHILKLVSTCLHNI